METSSDLFADEGAPMGVLALMAEAEQLGFKVEDSNRTTDGWVNFSRGEASDEYFENPTDPNAIVERRAIVKHPGVDAYGPVEGTHALREAYAGFYNRLHRGGLDPFNIANVSIRPGGRAAILSILAAFGKEGSGRGKDVRLGHFHPDYSGYTTALKAVRGINPVAIPLDRESGYHIDIAELRRVIRENSLEALLLSNPCNPTGTVIAGNELQQWVELSKETGIHIVFDEFYDEYVWLDEGQTRISCADYLEKIDESKIILVSGLSKAFQAAGWRIAVTMGSKNAIRAINRVAGGLDGGANHPLQAAAVPMLHPSQRDHTHKLRHANFLDKRKTMATALRDMGVTLASKPDGTFYLWGDITDLVRDRKQADVERMFLENRVIPWVPGDAFCVDTNEASRRDALPNYKNLARFSYGPRKDIMVAGLDRMREVVEKL